MDGNKESAASLLRDLRRRDGHTLRYAAGELGIAASQLSRIERGERSVGDDIARRISEYYRVPAEVISLADGRVPDDVVEILKSHPDEIVRLRQRYEQ